MIKYIFLPIIIAYILLSIIFSKLLQKKVEKYSKIKVEFEKDTIDIIKEILNENNITDITFNYKDNIINSFYDYKNKRLYLSKNSNSLSSRAILLHELGHILQFNENYKPLNKRTKMLPIFNVLDIFTPLLLIIGLLLTDIVLYISIICFVFCIMLNSLNVKIERDASRRALEVAEKINMLNKMEYKKMKLLLDLSKFRYIFSLFATFNKFKKSIF